MLTTLYPISVLHAFLPENIRIPCQDGLQQDWYISFWIIAAKVIFQFSAIVEVNKEANAFSNFKKPQSSKKQQQKQLK